MLKYLKYYGFDHHSRAIENALPALVENDVNEFLEYLESRQLENEHTQKLSRGAISEATGGMALTCYHMDPDAVKKEIFDAEGAETEVVTKIIDIPKVHDY